jgi:hypothetical protein
MEPTHKVGVLWQALVLLKNIELATYKCSRLSYYSLSDKEKMFYNIKIDTWAQCYKTFYICSL